MKHGEQRLMVLELMATYGFSFTELEKMNNNELVNWYESHVKLQSLYESIASNCGVGEKECSGGCESCSCGKDEEKQ